MPPAPVFDTTAAFVARRGDVAWWRPHVAHVLARHGYDTRPPLHAGAGATFPTFLSGDVVVKFFGFRRRWRTSFDAESAIHARLADDPAIMAPRTLAAGTLEGDAWRYRVTTRMGGVPWADARLDDRDRHRIAAALGGQVARLQRLRGDGLARHEDWPRAQMAAALARSSLPRHLVHAVGDFLAASGSFERVVVHGDLMPRHVFVDRGRLVGIIDWGDAIVTDRHYELAELHLDLFDGDAALLGTFLDAADWPTGPDFARKALATALQRQAHGVVQHDRMDVFHKLGAILGACRFDDLAALAAALFAVAPRGRPPRGGTRASAPWFDR
jgi:hypothetical protein